MLRKSARLLSNMVPIGLLLKSAVAHETHQYVLLLCMCKSVRSLVKHNRVDILWQ